MNKGRKDKSKEKKEMGRKEVRREGRKYLFAGQGKIQCDCQLVEFVLC